MSRREELVARTMVDLADTLVDDFDVVDLLRLLTDRCVESLGVTAAGILLQGPEGDLRPMASSSDVLRSLELLEVRTGEGPCLDCFRLGVAVVEPDVAATDRWPRFGPAAREAGLLSVAALPMRLRGTTIGALNMFRTGGAVSAEDAVVAQALADVATIAILQDRLAREAQVVNEQLSQALDSRIVIEQAKGVLAEQLGIGVDEALPLLRARARSHRTRLAAVARTVVTGEVGGFELRREGPDRD